MRISREGARAVMRAGARTGSASVCLAALILLAGGCSSQPTYPKQVITVLPPAAGNQPSFPPAVTTYPGVSPSPAPPAASQVPGETRPSVPGEAVAQTEPGAAPGMAQAPEGSVQSGPIAPPGAAVSSHYNQGVLLFRQGNVPGAIQEFRMAIAENPGDARARNSLGVLLEKSGDIQGAIFQYQSALRTDPNNRLSHRLLARALAQSGNLNGAIDQYAAAIKLDPKDPGAHNDFGVALHMRGDDRDAIYQYREALALDPQDFAAHRNLADAYNETGDGAQAVKELQVASRLRPDDPVIHNALGSLLFEQNDLSGAMAQWQAANRIDPRSPDALAGMSIGFWKMGLKRQAVDSYRQAAALAPGYLCDDNQLRAQGHWNGPALAVLHEVAKAPGAPPCSGT